MELTGKGETVGKRKRPRCLKEHRTARELGEPVREFLRRGRPPNKRSGLMLENLENDLRVGDSDFRKQLIARLCGGRELCPDCLAADSD